MKRIDYMGKRIGRLTVIGVSSEAGKYLAWDCVCDCGTKTTVLSTNLRANHTTSCGCQRRDKCSQVGKKTWEQNKPKNKTHGQSCIDAQYNETREYRIWTHMKQRCYNEKRDNYKHYGGRGISMCKEWKDSFEAFFRDMGPSPDGYEIDRINNDGNYEPSNCRWVTHAENTRNQRPKQRKNRYMSACT